MSLSAWTLAILSSITEILEGVMARHARWIPERGGETT